jgi:uncharacterized protein (DUF58 family)
MSELKRCHANMTDSTGWHRTRCQNPAKYESGRCGIHDPDKVKERAAARPPSVWEERYREAAHERLRIKQLQSVMKEVDELLKMSWPKGMTSRIRARIGMAARGEVARELQGDKGDD